jgi:hypothetical protein
MKMIVLAVLMYSATAFAAPCDGVACSIANGAVQNNTESRTITRDKAREIYLLRDRVGNSSTFRVQVFRLGYRDPVHRRFVEQVLNLTEQEFEKEWGRMVNSGYAGEIRMVRTETEMMSSVAATPRGVGYLSADYIVLNAGGANVAVIRIVD